MKQPNFLDIKKGRQVPPPNSKSKYLRAITALIGIQQNMAAKVNIFCGLSKFPG